MSSFEPTTLSKEDAEFIASTVLEVLDKKETHRFVKNKLLQDAHISRVTQQEISTNVQFHDVSLSTDENDTSTSTQGSNFHSVPSTRSESPVSVNIVSGAVQFSPVKNATPEKTSPPKLLSLRHQRRQLKDRFARYDQAATVTIQQLINPPVPQPAAATAAPTASPKKPCSVCDNSRFFLLQQLRRHSAPKSTTGSVSASKSASATGKGSTTSFNKKTDTSTWCSKRRMGQSVSYV